MATDVDICNSALGELGDTATVTSINPPSGSVQAGYCAAFYPMARDELLGLHRWLFATQRISLALLTETPPASWTYAYQVPQNCLDLIEVLDPNASDDYSAGLAQYGNLSGSYNYNVGIYTPQPFETETDDNGNLILYTNQQNAVLRCIVQVTDTTKFTPLFTAALIKLLKSKLAGPVVKGQEGRNESKAALEEFRIALGLATTQDSNKHRTKAAPSTDWIVNR